MFKLNIKNMSISNKIIFPLVILLIISNIIVSNISSKNIKSVINDTTQQSLMTLSDSIFLTLRTSMNTADPAIIKATENEIRDKLKGLKNLTVAKSQKTLDLYSPNEKITNNKILLNAMSNKKDKIITNENNIQIVRPMIAKNECLACHTTHKVGETIGVISLSFDLSAINKEATTSSIQQAIISAIIAIITIFILILIIKKSTLSISKFKNNLNEFFEYINGEKDDIKPFAIDSHDEIGQMIEEINKSIEKTFIGLEKDKQLIKEANEVIAKVKLGFCAYQINNDANNPQLNELKNSLNDMATTIKFQLDEILNALIEYGNGNFKYNLKLNNTGGDMGSVVMGTKSLANNISELLAMNVINGEKLGTNINQLSRDVNQLSTSSNNQATALEETSTAIEEISANMLSSSQNVDDMLTLAHEVTSLANNGEKLANETQLSMTKINEQVSQINEAISMIDQISFQTNILSLNAAVEAATAGEAGKGFAVVAQEVRNLASRSSDVAKTIQELVHNAKEKAQLGKDIASNMIEGYDQLNDKISQTKEKIDTVSISSGEQKSAISQINNSITKINTETNINAKTATQISGLSNDVKDLSVRLIESSQHADFEEEIKEQVCDLELVNTLNSLKLDHIHFKDAAFSKVNEFKSFTVTNHTQCRLGKWIKEQEEHKTPVTNTSIWQDLKVFHENVHVNVQTYIDQNANHANSKELALLAQKTEDGIDHTFKILDSIKKHSCSLS